MKKMWHLRMEKKTKLSLYNLFQQISHRVKSKSISSTSFTYIFLLPLLLLLLLLLILSYKITSYFYGEKYFQGYRYLKSMYIGLNLQ